MLKATVDDLMLTIAEQSVKIHQLETLVNRYEQERKAAVDAQKEKVPEDK